MALIELFCQQCGDRFSTSSWTERFCGRRCGNLFAARRRLSSKLLAPSRRQAELLAILRRYRGHWVWLPNILDELYGSAGRSEHLAFKTLLQRLRLTWGANGLVIECRFRKATPYDRASTFYRLVRDVRDVDREAREVETWTA